MLEELWMEVCDTVQEAVIKTIPKKNKCKKAKWLSEEGLQTAVKRREEKGKEGAESRWRRNRTGDHFLFYKFIERTTER